MRRIIAGMAASAVLLIGPMASIGSAKPLVQGKPICVKIDGVKVCVK